MTALENLIETVSIELEAYFQKSVFFEKSLSKKLIESELYSLMAGGKRLRPVLLKIFYMNSQEKHSNPTDDNSHIVPYMAAIEMIHTYSLIHDDLPCMDNDDLRRGKPSNHKVYEEWGALLAGDSLLTKAFEVLSLDDSAKVSLTKKIKIINMIAKNIGDNGMIAGQFVDMLFTGEQLTKDILEFIHTNKTAKLIATSCAVGAILGDESEENIARAYDYGLKIGLAFQIVDDILDVTASSETLGKEIGKDKDNNKFTYLDLFDFEDAYKYSAKLVKEANSYSDFHSKNSLITEVSDYIINRYK